MTEKIFDGKKFAAKLLEESAGQIALLRFKPILCDILIGSDPVASSYVRIKEKAAKASGLEFKAVTLTEDANLKNVVETILKLNREPRMSGMILQLPLPRELEKHRQELLDVIDPRFDVDCLGSVQKSNFYSNQKSYSPPAAAAVEKIVKYLDWPMSQKQTVIVGKGELVGRPVAHFFKRYGWPFKTVSLNTPSGERVISESDLIILGAGHPGLLKGEMVKPGAAVIDAGTSESEGGIVGDADTPSLKPRISFITPVPGGVGPVTVAMLIKNTILSAETKNTEK